jgi:hypothetical protein
MLPARRLAAAAQSLSAHLRDLQWRAAMTGQPLQLVLDPSGHALPDSTGRQTHTIWPDDIAVTLVGDEHGQVVRTLTMYPDGSSSGGRFELRRDHRLVTVRVSSLTGRIHVSQ